MKTREVFLLVLIGILLAGVGFMAYRVVSVQKRAAHLSALVEAYKTAKPDTVITTDTVKLPGSVRIIPYPVKTVIIDTVLVPLKLSWYDSTFRQGGIRFRWRAFARGTLDTLTFSDFVYPKEIVTITQRADTCIDKPPAYKPMLIHWGLYSELNVNNFRQFPGIGAGLQMIVKDRMTIGAGVMYADKPYGNIRIGVLIR